MNTTMHAIFAEKNAAASNRLMTEASASDSPPKLVTKLLELQKVAAKEAGALWPPVPMEQRAAAGTGWHVLPNLISLPNGTVTMCYRSRPWGNGSNAYCSVYDSWSL